MKDGKPYSEEDYQKAKKLGLDLDDWNHYKMFFKLEDFAEGEVILDA